MLPDPTQALPTRALPRESAYIRLARDLRNRVLKSEFAGGRALPTEAVLAAEYGVSRQTVRRAFHDLVAEELVYRVPGRGTFAAERSDKFLRQIGAVEDLIALSGDTELRILDPAREHEDARVAAALQLDEDRVVTIRFLREHGGVPFCVTTVHVAPGTAALLEPELSRAAAGDHSTITVLGLIDERLDAPISEADQTITAASAEAEVATVLGVSAGEALLHISRLYYDTGGVPRELAESYFLPDQYAHRVRLRRKP